MMRAARSASLLVAFSLLTSAATAYADCAWVLWAYSLEKSIGEQYSVELARPTRQECVKEVREFGVTMKEQDRKSVV